MTHILVALLALSLGWLLGIVSVSVGLRQQLRVLDLERAELDADRKRLATERRAHFDQVTAWVAATTDADAEPVPTPRARA